MSELFDPKSVHAPAQPEFEALGERLGDRRDGKVYVHDARIVDAVRTAQAIRRPLLLRGPAGSGKSSLAPFVARVLGGRFYSFTVTARTQARDLMWSFDPLHRLNDAQTASVLEGPERKETVARVRNLESYVSPRVLWWALHPPDAARAHELSHRGSDDRSDGDPGVGPSGGPAVVLIDEIDKADPDVPNNLLECLGSLQFTVEETGHKVVVGNDDRPPIVLVTTNDERELPAAFVRRCAVLHLEQPADREQRIARLEKIANAHFEREEIDGPDGEPVDDGVKLERYQQVAQRLESLAERARKEGVREPSTAEYLDAVRACLRLGAGPDTEDEQGERLWRVIESVTLTKREEPEAADAGGA